MISIEEALQIIKSNIPSPVACELPIEKAAGRHLAEDIHAPEPSPRYTNSAMDGYAARWEDICSCSREKPADLEIVGESRAGHPFRGTVEKGQAVRISTGAMPAEGCDTVVRVEDTEERNSRVLIFAVKKKGQDLRRQGEEFQTGDLLLQKRTKISSPQLALLATVGIQTVRVFKPCEVAVLVTGSELVASGREIADHQIRDSNMIMMQSAIAESGGQVTQSLRIVDDEEATREAIAAAKADIIICTGGVSVGRHDHVKAAAEANGFTPPLLENSPEARQTALFRSQRGNASFRLARQSGIGLYVFCSLRSPGHYRLKRPALRLAGDLGRGGSADNQLRKKNEHDSSSAYLETRRRLLHHRRGEAGIPHADIPGRRRRLYHSGAGPGCRSR